MTSDKLFFDHYQVQTDATGHPLLLSSDGTGTTFRAIDSLTQRPVLVRVFGDQLLGNGAVQKDFVERAKLLIELDHANITRIIDTGQQGDQFYYVLKDPGGQMLDSLVNKAPLSISLALRLQSQLVDALMAVRSQPGLMSRVWPRSLMVDLEPTPKVTLIAQNLLNPTPPIESAEFLAPEMLADGAETVQATLYSLGAIFYFMLTGRPPHPAQDSVEEMIRVKQRLSPDFSALPPAAPVTLISQLLERNPRARPKSLLEWDKALQRFIRFTPNEASGQEVMPANQMANPAMPKQATSSVFISPMPAPELAAELAKAQAHTQRLSLELTRRVQKELALTEQLKALELDLEREKKNVEASSRKGPSEPTEAASSPEVQDLRKAKADLASQWEKLHLTQKQVEREKREVLEKTQRLTIKAKELERERTEFLKVTQRIHVKPSVGTPSPTREATPKPKFPLINLWSRKTAKQPVAEQKPAAAELAVPTAEEPKPTTPFDPPFASPKAPTAAVSLEKETQELDLPAGAPLTPFELAAQKEAALPAEAEPSAIAKAPVPEPPRAEAEAARPEVAPTLAAPLKPITAPTPVSLAPPEAGIPAPAAVPAFAPIQAVPSLKPAEASAPAINPKPTTNVVVPKPQAVSVAPPTGRPIEPAFEVIPVRAAWAALAILALLLGFMLLKVYQTFFRSPISPASHSRMMDRPAAKSVLPTAARSPLAATEQSVNDALKLELQRDENQKLVQEQDWKALRQRMQLLRKNWPKDNQATLRNLEADLLQLLQQSSARGSKATEDSPDYQELRRYLAESVERQS